MNKELGTCYVRDALLEDDRMGAYVSYFYIKVKRALKYRWVDGDCFVVKVSGCWCDADPDDFDLDAERVLKVGVDI